MAPLRWGTLFLAICASAPHAKPEEPSEYKVKAAFLMNFTKFVEWPPSAFADSSSPLTICVIGDDPFGSDLDQAVEGETAGGRRLAVQRMRRTPAPKTCQVLFIPRNEKGTAELLQAAGPGVLTVGDRDNFLSEGGMVTFVLHARHVRFDINLPAASKAGLTISARLLAVARAVLR
ncbi:MAG TPA: YfiR family protein [Candidatus Limnocylindrales bacterium]|nr:YfiR family protein [Candidatus Limnocylindrales bacterium]